ncbi:MAG: DNA polymerase III subunit alpha, partial [Proteobacteria bacterium]|nr:DNA polymerase III subunit alpha [Pseudomonadota bacterium]
KIDLLGNRSLGVIRDALANLKENRTAMDESALKPEDDPATQSTMASGNTMGCFYIESPTMRLLQKRSRTGDFEHLVLHSSIIRPAANEFIREYLKRLHGAPWDPIHPLLCDVLDETYGLMVYQEDVSKAAMALAGFCDADADALRKIMTKKDKTRRLPDFKQRFFEGAAARGVGVRQIEAVWAMMMSFSGYSFCKPHSASYAQVSFQAAFLKTHYPAEFMAAVLSNQGGFYSPFAYVSETRRMGIQILPADVNRSDIRWKGHQKTVRVGLLSVRNLSAQTIRRIIAQRQGRPYRSLSDFADRVHPAEDEARSLIFAGAFDAICSGQTRAGLLWELAGWQKSARQKKRDLFGDVIQPAKPSFPPETTIDRLRREYEVLGFLCDRHPLELYADVLRPMHIVKAKDLARFAGKQVRIAGLLITGKKVRTKHGDLMEFLTFEDETGLVEATFFPKAYQRFCAVLDCTRPFMLHGKVEEEFGAVTLTVERVTPVSKP